MGKRMYKSIEEIIREREEQIYSLSNDLQKIKDLSEEFPDLEQYINKYWSFTLTSSLVNSKATDVRFFLSEKDLYGYSEIYAAPCIRTRNTGLLGLVFSKPALFLIANQKTRYDVKAIDNWQRELIDNNISEAAIEIINNFFIRSKNVY